MTALDEGHLYSSFLGFFFILVPSDTKPLESLLLRRFGIKWSKETPRTVTANSQ